MHPGEAWYVLSCIAFIIAIVGMIFAFFVLGSIVRQVSPLLTETKQHIQDLGDAKLAGIDMTKQTRTVYAVLSAVLVGAQFVRFVRKVF
jgi:hypothetical protein